MPRLQTEDLFRDMPAPEIKIVFSHLTIAGVLLSLGRIYLVRIYALHSIPYISASYDRYFSFPIFSEEVVSLPFGQNVKFTIDYSKNFKMVLLISKLIKGIYACTYLVNPLFTTKPFCRLYAKHFKMLQKINVFLFLF